ncbi:MAG: M56 family metallopeptidase [Bacteroidota bacterium]|nr:M56 family metallopeptidase [Bacteroidota bacterium]
MNFAALQHSIFLQALGSAILNSLWQGLLLWVIFETIAVSYKAASAKFKHNLSAVILFFSFIWFVINFITKIFNASGASTSIAMQTVRGHEFSVSSFWNYHAFLSYGASALPYLSVAYIFLLFFLTARLVAAYRHVYFISNNQLAIPPFQLQAFARSVSSQIGITKKISVWISHHVDVPATIGFLKPVILIPFASINNLSAPQLEAIILHELSHIQRNDYIINLCISVIETTLFFNPFIVLLSNVIKRERENCCDDFVLQYQYDPHSYASALLRLEQSRQSKLQLAIGAVSGKKQLLSRIKRITNKGVVSRQFNYGQKLLALLLVTFIICSVAWLSPADKPVVSNTFNKDKRATVLVNKKLLSKIDNPAVIKEKVSALLTLVEPREVRKKLDTVLIDNNSNNLHEDIGNGWKQLADFLPLKGNKDSMVLKLIRNSFLREGDKKFEFSKIEMKNFPIQKMDFSNNFENAVLDKINEGLGQAYKAISDVNLNEIKNTINESLSSEKAKALITKNEAFLYLEKVQNMGKLLALRQQLAPQEILFRKMQKDFASQDSMRSEQAARENSFEFRLENEIKRAPRLKRHNEKTENSFYYSTDEAAPKIIHINKNENWPGDKAPLPKSKDLKISIKRLPGTTNISTDKNVTQFYLSADGKKSSGFHNIDVEITN